MDRDKSSTQAAIEALTRRRDAGEITEAAFDREVAKLLSLDRVPAFANLEPSRQAPTVDRRRRWPIERALMVVAWVTAAILAGGLITTASDDQSYRHTAAARQSELTDQVASLQSDNGSLNTRLNTLTATNQDLQTKARSPSVTLWQVSSATLPFNSFYAVAIPDGFQVAVNLTSATTALDVRFMRAVPFIQWYNGGNSSGGGEGWYGQTAFNGTFTKATGCADYFLVINGRTSSTF